MIRARVWTKQATGLPYDALQKNPGGWRTPAGVRTGAGSNSSGRIVRHGLQVKPWRGPRVRGSVLCTSMGLISSTLCHGNGSINMRIWLNRFGTHSRESSDANATDVRDDPPPPSTRSHFGSSCIGSSRLERTPTSG